MKLRTLLLTLGVGLMGAAAAQAAETSGMKMDGMKMEESAKAPVNRTRGVVKEFNTAKGTVTLSHDPVPALKWPAMTMAFKISPELATGIAVGQKVEFEFQAEGMNATISKIAPVR